MESCFDKFRSTPALPDNHKRTYMPDLIGEMANDYFESERDREEEDTWDDECLKNFDHSEDCFSIY